MLLFTSCIKQINLYTGDDEQHEGGNNDDDKEKPQEQTYLYPFGNEVQGDITAGIFIKVKDAPQVPLEAGMPCLKYNKPLLLLLVQDDCKQSAYCRTWAAINGKPVSNSDPYPTPTVQEPDKTAQLYYNSAHPVSYTHLLRNKRKFLLAPRMFPFAKHPGQRNPLKRLLSLAGYYLVPALLRLRNIRAGANGELIDNDELPYYIAASDVIFVQRKRILNSGNVPLAFLFRKVVAGPDNGNVGELLRETGNPVFSPDDNAGIVRALEQAGRLAEQGKGEENYRYARQHMNLAVSYTHLHRESLYLLEFSYQSQFIKSLSPALSAGEGAGRYSCLY